MTSLLHLATTLLSLLATASSLRTNPLRQISLLQLINIGKSPKNFTELAAANGYQTEEHSVITEDGYILPLFRIVYSKHCKGIKRQPPVILMHGLFMSSDGWLDAGPENGLPYLLADACYDIWVGNQRGTTQGRRHVQLNPDKDPQFWEFSVDEIGRYDIPANVDYVLRDTRASQVNYIGLSQGGGTFFIMCSERPGYCNKIGLFIGLAPATRHLNTKSLFFRLITEGTEAVKNIFDKLGIYEVFAQGGPFWTLYATICPFAMSTRGFCGQFLAIFDAPHPDSVALRTIRQLFERVPAGTSTQNLARYGQAMRSAEFVKYDYGRFDNLKLYGSTSPPAYNLSAVTTPVVIVHGQNDGIVDVEDIDWLLTKLPNVLERYEVRDRKWNHLDHVYSHIRKETWPVINEYLDKFSDYY